MRKLFDRLKINTFLHNYGRSEGKENGKPRDEVDAVRFRQNGQLLIAVENGREISGETVANRTAINNPIQLPVWIQFRLRHTIDGTTRGMRPEGKRWFKSLCKRDVKG